MAQIAQDAQAEQHAKEAWVASARRWLRKRKGDETKGSKGPPKKFRKKAYHWLVSLNSSLATVAGKSLTAFKVDKDESKRPPPEEWPYLMISADQGPDGVCASFFARYHQFMNVDFFWDPSHGHQRDILASIGQVGLSAWMHLMTVVYNLGHGPWDSHARFSQLSESTSTYIENHVQRCPIFNHYKYHIAQDFGMTDEPGAQVSDDDIISAMRQHWTTKRKGAKVHLCRFGDFINKAAEADKYHHFFLLRCLHLGLDEGMFGEAVLEVLRRPQKLNTPDLDKQEAKIEVARSNDAHQSIRSLAKNNIAVAAIMLSDPLTQVRARCVHMLPAPMSSWFSVQSRTLRSSSEAANWLLQQVTGTIWTPFRQVVGQLSDSSVLESLGMTLSFFPGVEEYALDDPIVVENDEVAELAGLFVLALLGCRDRRLMYITEGWTGLQALFFSDCADDRMQACTRLRKQYEAFRELSRQDDKVCKAIARRSIFQQAPTVQLVELLTRNGWEPTRLIAEHCKNRVSGVLQSKVAEDLIGAGRRLEKPAPNPTQLPKQKLWKFLIDEKVVDGLYRFEEPRFRDVQVPRGREGNLPPGLFAADFKGAPAALRAVAGTKQTVPWHTSGVTNMHLVYADLYSTTLAHERNDWKSLQTTYFSALAEGKNMAMKKVGSSKWFFSLGGNNPIAARGWPAVATMRQDELLFLELDMTGKPEWILVTDPEAWQAVTFQWHSPLRQYLADRSRRSQVRSKPSLVAYPIGKPKPLIQEAACQGFWDIPKANLMWFCRYYGVEVNSQASLCAVLKGLILKLMPKTSDERLVEMLAKRSDI